MMSEETRRGKKIEPANEELWKQENAVMEVFDQLICNMDRNQTNMLIDMDWHLWLIDHSRSFRTRPTLKAPTAVRTVDRTMLAKMKVLDEPMLTKELGRNVSKDEIRGL